MTKLARALIRHVERRIETALIPGRFVSYDAGSAFVRDLEAVEQRLSTCLAADPAHAANPYEAFLAGCQCRALQLRAAAMLRPCKARRRVAAHRGEVRRDHHRQTGFMAGFEEIVADFGRSRRAVVPSASENALD